MCTLKRTPATLLHLLSYSMLNSIEEKPQLGPFPSLKFVTFGRATHLPCQELLTDPFLVSMKEGNSINQVCSTPGPGHSLVGATE
jgi:hypothetical protein